MVVPYVTCYWYVPFIVLSLDVAHVTLHGDFVCRTTIDANNFMNFDDLKDERH
jgi:hypothetical protein